MSSDKDKSSIPLQSPQEYVPKVSLKKTVQTSMFDNKPARPTQQEFQQQVQKTQETLSGYKKRAADLFVQFQRTISDRTLSQNRNVLHIESEKEMLQNMLQLAIDINNDPNEQEGMGSLTWITLLFKTCLAQRDRLNELEFALINLQNKLNSSTLVDLINKEISKAFDNKKGSE